MFITTTEFKNKMEKYLELSKTEDIFISKNRKVIAKLTSPNKDRLQMTESLIGVVPADITLQEARNEKVKRI